MLLSLSVGRFKRFVNFTSFPSSTAWRPAPSIVSGTYELSIGGGGDREMRNRSRAWEGGEKGDRTKRRVQGVGWGIGPHERERAKKHCLKELRLCVPTREGVCLNIALQAARDVTLVCSETQKARKGHFPTVVGNFSF